MPFHRRNAYFESAETRDRLMRLWKVSKRELGLGRGNKFYLPTLANLARFARTLHLDTGGALRAFGIDPNVIRDTTWRWRSERTRPISSYEFDRGGMITVPLAYSTDASVWERNAFLSELVPRFQSVPRRALANELWQNAQCYYARLGLGDFSCLPLIPPGASLQIGRVSAGERANPDPKTLYFMKLPYGYGCGYCRLLPEALEVHEVGERFPPKRFRYLGPALSEDVAAEPDPGRRAKLEAERLIRICENRVRILGKIVAFYVDFEEPWAEANRRCDEPSDVPARLIAEMGSLAELVELERRRWRWTQHELDAFSEQIHSAIGFTVSGRRIQGIVRSETPRLSTAVALSVLYCHRLEDVLAKCGLLLPDSTRYDLQTLLAATSVDDLPTLEDLDSRVGSPPEPFSRHTDLLREWIQFPSVLPSLEPSLSLRSTRKILRLNQTSLYKGLDPLLPTGSLLIAETQFRSRSMLREEEMNLPKWRRPIYVFETRRLGLICSHAARNETGEIVTLLPCSGSEQAPQIFRSQDIDLISVVVGAASRF